MNQSETNPLATALAALMTGHNANPNTSLRIPLVDSNGNLQPGPTLAELASVLGVLSVNVITQQTDADTLTKAGFYQGNAWVNTPLTTGMLIMPYYRNGFWRFQLFCDTGSTNLWFRSGNSGSYGVWKKIV